MSVKYLKAILLGDQFTCFIVNFSSSINIDIFKDLICQPMNDVWKSYAKIQNYTLASPPSTKEKRSE